MILNANPTWLGVALSDWADIGTVAAAVVGVIAAIIAAVAIIQARLLQRSASEPYVAVMLESNEHFQELGELVIKNYGSTAAHAVEVEFDPPAMRIGNSGPDTIKPLKVPSLIPTLVPGQEWRTTWDVGSEHKRHELASEYTVTVTYKGLRRRKHTDQFVIDWSAYYDHTYLQVKTIHHVAKNLAEANTLLRNGIGVKSVLGVRLKWLPARLEQRWALYKHRRMERLIRKKNPQLFQDEAEG